MGPYLLSGFHKNMAHHVSWDTIFCWQKAVKIYRELEDKAMEGA